MLPNINSVSFLQKAPIDPFTRESCKPSATQGVPLGGMGYDVLFTPTPLLPSPPFIFL